MLCVTCVLCVGCCGLVVFVWVFGWSTEHVEHRDTEGECDAYEERDGL